MLEERAFTEAELKQLEFVRNYLRASVAYSSRKPVLICIGLHMTGVEAALRMGMEKEVIAGQLRRLADNIVNGTHPLLFAPEKLRLQGLEKK
jgi:hypothetical protein